MEVLYRVAFRRLVLLSVFFLLLLASGVLFWTAQVHESEESMAEVVHATGPIALREGVLREVVGWQAEGELAAGRGEVWHTEQGEWVEELQRVQGSSTSDYASRLHAEDVQVNLSTQVVTVHAPRLAGEELQAAAKVGWIQDENLSCEGFFARVEGSEVAANRAEMVGEDICLVGDVSITDAAGQSVYSDEMEYNQLTRLAKMCGGVEARGSDWLACAERARIQLSPTRSIEEVRGEEEIRVVRGGVTMWGERARYVPKRLAELSAHKGDCLARWEAGHTFSFSRARAELDSGEYEAYQVVGECMQEDVPVSVAADFARWVPETKTLFGQGEVAIDHPVYGRLEAEERMRVEMTEGGKGLAPLALSTEGTSHFIQRSSQRSMTCYGQSTLDLLTGSFVAKSPQEGGALAEQIIVEDGVGRLRSDFIEASLTPDRRALHSITALGRVRLCGKEVEGVHFANWFTVADRVDYDVTTRRLHLGATAPAKVLWYDAKEHVSLSASGLTLLAGPNGNPTIQGSRDVRLTLRSKDLATLRKSFALPFNGGRE